jgi:prepilin-type N-terminal cleavage/methylation domain-containing protein
VLAGAVLLENCRMKRAFSLVELIIVVSILGILAAIALPRFQSQTQEAKEAAAKDNLRILRTAIKLYAAQHNDTPPGYLNNNMKAEPKSAYAVSQLTMKTNIHGQYDNQNAADCVYGPYLPEIPINPLTGTSEMWTAKMEYPAPLYSPERGWFYCPPKLLVKPNVAGKDLSGVDFFQW